MKILTEGDSLTVNQIARRTGFHWKTCANVLRELEALGQAEKEEIGGETRYQLRVRSMRPSWKGGSLSLHKRFQSETVEVDRPSENRIRVVR
ncbi:MAG: hypothetical protein ACE5Z5_03615 [Candidatus Bathyarchaeia archaeon]